MREHPVHEQMILAIAAIALLGGALVGDLYDARGAKTRSQEEDLDP